MTLRTALPADDIAAVDSLRAELDILRRQMQRQQADLGALQRPRPAGRPAGRGRYLAPFALALLVALIPLGLLGAGPFTDLDPASPHNADIAAIQLVGITKGCDPPAFAAYCPKANVTREEMASFLARTAGLGGNPPVVNALTAASAQTATHATTADTAASATTAGNAEFIGGFAPASLLRVARGVTDPDGIFLSCATRDRQPLATVTITTPGAGFVLVIGAASFGKYSGTNPLLPGYRLREVAPFGASSREQVALLTPDLSQTTGSTAYLFDAPTPGQHTYLLEARCSSGSDDGYAHLGEITALFVPFGATGDTLSPAP